MKMKIKSEVQKFCAAFVSLVAAGFAIYFFLLGWKHGWKLDQMTFAVCLAIFSDITWLPYKKVKK